MTASRKRERNSMQEQTPCTPICLSTGVNRFGAQPSSLLLSGCSLSTDNYTPSIVALPLMKFQIGAKVLIEGNRSGTVKYFGPVSGKPGDWVGVELDFALGKHDGTAAGYLILCFINHHDDVAFLRIVVESSISDASLSTDYLYFPVR